MKCHITASATRVGGMAINGGHVCAGSVCGSPVTLDGERIVVNDEYVLITSLLTK